MPGWRNGRREGLKIPYRKVCGFNYRPRHHVKTREASFYVPRATKSLYVALQRAFTWRYQRIMIHCSAMYSVYVLESLDSERWYIGYTTNPKRRFDEHNNHKNISTAKERLWKMIYCESYTNKMDALGREKFLKSGSGWKFLKKQLSHYLESKKISK